MDMAVQVPWKNCRLVHAYGNTVTAVASADLVIDLELNAASGTTIGTITLPTSSSAIGDTADMVIASAGAGQNLDRDVTTRDAINIETVTASGAAAADIFLYFEQEVNQ